MRIGIFDPYLDTLSGGEKYILSAALCLAKQHEVYVFWDDEDKIRKTAASKLGLDLSSVKFYRNIFSKNVSLLSRLINYKKFDSIIYLSNGSIPFVGTKLFIHFQFPVEWIDGRSIKTRLKLAFVKKIICNSYFTKYFIDKKLNANSDVLYPPINLRVNRNIKKENTILHIGRFAVDSHGVNYKKQDVMISIFKRMIDDGLKDWKLVMIIGTKAGDKNNVEKLKKMIVGYPIEIIENPTSQILWENYSKAKIYWHATGYGENLQKYPEKAEHFGMSTVEAMGSGVVPVVINAGGQKEIVENGKNGYLWDTLEDFANKTKNLISNEGLWKEMSEKAVRRSEKFCGNRFCNELNKIINIE